MRLITHIAPTLVAGFCATASVVWAASPPPRPPAPEESVLRELVYPLREGLTGREDLQPLLTWLTQQEEAARSSRRAEQELRRTLKRMHDEYVDDLRRSAEWVDRLQVQRSRLYTTLAEDGGSLARAMKDYGEFPPLPAEEELLPANAELPDEFLTAPGVNGAPDFSLADPPAAELTPADGREIETHQLIDRITSDLTALRHLLHACDSEYEREKKRHRTALAALSALIKERRQRPQNSR